MAIESIGKKNYNEIIDSAAELTSGQAVQQRQAQKSRIKAILKHMRLKAPVLKCQRFTFTSKLFNIRKTTFSS